MMRMSSRKRSSPALDIRQPIEDHVVEATEMVPVGSGAPRRIDVVPGDLLHRIHRELSDEDTVKLDIAIAANLEEVRYGG